jgi:pimeloyl-ACP methyl ester carboxylesterase
MNLLTGCQVPAEIKDHNNPGRVRHTKCGIKPENTVQLAIIKLPYVPAGADAPPHQGAVHVALGGWSSSSTNFLVRYGKLYQAVFTGYDLIAIGGNKPRSPLILKLTANLSPDYRGWGWTTPPFRCFESETERQAWFASEPVLLGASDDALHIREQRAAQFGEKCKKNGDHVGKYMGTYASAVDHYTVMKADNRTKMGFWAFSSGTHVAQTVAMLYPEAVDKFLLDSMLLLPTSLIWFIL